MTPQSILLGVGAGLISATVFASATTGPLLSRLVLFLLTPFSLYLAGLGLGFVPVLAGAAAATALILVMSNPMTAFTYAIAEALPAVALTRLALLSHGEGEDRQWYPVGRIVIASALIAGALAFFFLAAQGADTDALVKAVRPSVDEFAKTQLPSLPGGEQLTEPQLAEMTSIIVASLPGAIGLSLMVTALGGLWLAGRILLASGHLARPWPDFGRIELPIGSAMLLLGATALSFTGPSAWLLTDGLASALRLAFAFLGLAVIHHVTQDSPWRGFIRTTVYAALLILTKHTLLILALIGLAETIFHYRRVATSSPPPPDGT